MSAAFGAAVCALLLAGCAEPRAQDTGTTSASPSASGSTVATAVPSPSATLGHRDVSIGGKSASLEVYGLHRRGRLVVLDFGVRNPATGKVTGANTVVAGNTLSRSGSWNVDGVTLVDGKNKKRYLPASYGGECACSGQMNVMQVGPGHTLNLTAAYSAPPSDVTTVTVQFAAYGTVPNVPIR